MGVPTIKTGPMTVEEYFAFTETRPDNEKWELIDGEPILNASPSRSHQRIFWNLALLIGTIQRQRPQSWEASPGIGVRVSDTSLPEPDVFIVPAGSAQTRPLSPGDQRRPRRVRNPLAFDGGARSALEAHGLYQPALAHALRGDRPGRGRYRGVRARPPDSRSGTCGHSPIRSNCRRWAFRCRWRRFIATPICDSD